MRRCSLAFALAFGCYNPTYATDVPCDPSAPQCPNGEQCLASGTGYTCGGTMGTKPADGSIAPDTYNPFGDDDGDGVPNGVDNCPEVPNPGQENEDGDAWGDVCDLCPPYASTTQVDSDGDGVGDECDPRPNTPGDKMILFEGFHHAVPSGSGWATMGTVMQAGDSVLVEDPGSGSFSALGWAFTPGSRETITTQLEVISMVGGQIAIASVVDTADPDGDTGIACEVGNDASGSGYQDLYTLPNGPDITFQPDTVNVDDSRRVAIARNNQNYACVDIAPSSTGTISGTSALTSSNPVLGISAQAATVQFDWLMVVQSN